MNSKYRFNRCAPWIVAVHALLFSCANAYCGPLPPPMEVELDLATRVVIGQLVQFDKEFDPSGGLQKATATIAVKTTLKGPSAKTVKTAAVIGIGTAGWGGSWVPHIRKTGDAGIWILGNASGTFGLVPESKLEEVKYALDFLANRKWTDAKDGLVAWAGVLYPQYLQSPRPWIALAIRNVSERDIYYPLQGGRAAAVGQSSQIVRTTGTRNNRERVFCRKVRPGATVYVESYFFASFFRDLPPDTYKVTLSYENSRDGETATGPAHYVAVEAWKGVLRPSPVTVFTGKTTKRESTQQNPAGDVPTAGPEE